MPARGIELFGFIAVGIASLADRPFIMPGVEKLFSFQAYGQIKQPGKHRTHTFRPVVDYLFHQSCKLCIVWFPHFVTSMVIWSLSWNNKRCCPR